MIKSMDSLHLKNVVILYGAGTNLLVLVILMEGVVVIMVNVTRNRKLYSEAK